MSETVFCRLVRDVKFFGDLAFEKYFFELASEHFCCTRLKDGELILCRPTCKICGGFDSTDINEDSPTLAAIVFKYGPVYYHAPNILPETEAALRLIHYTRFIKRGIDVPHIHALYHRSWDAPSVFRLFDNAFEKLEDLVSVSIENFEDEEVTSAFYIFGGTSLGNKWIRCAERAAYLRKWENRWLGNFVASCKTFRRQLFCTSRTKTPTEILVPNGGGEPILYHDNEYSYYFKNYTRTSLRMDESWFLAPEDGVLHLPQRDDGESCRYVFFAPRYRYPCSHPRFYKDMYKVLVRYFGFSHGMIFNKLRYEVFRLARFLPREVAMSFSDVPALTMFLARWRINFLRPENKCPVFIAPELEEILRLGEVCAEWDSEEFFTIRWREIEARVTLSDLEQDFLPYPLSTYFSPSLLLAYLENIFDTKKECTT